jgi:hypothetical protein
MRLSLVTAVIFTSGLKRPSSIPKRGGKKNFFLFLFLANKVCVCLCLGGLSESVYVSVHVTTLYIGSPAFHHTNA